MPDLKFVALVFAIILLVVIGVRQSIKKAHKRLEQDQKPAKIKELPQKPRMTEEQYSKAWNSLSYLILLAAAGSLYMAYTAVKSALAADSAVAWVFWIDASFSFLAAVAAVIVWRKPSKSMVYLYFGLNLVPIILFMSIKGVKINALIHLFPLVLLYFVLKPIWVNMKD
jgi:hypothetical protein